MVGLSRDRNRRRGELLGLGIYPGFLKTTCLTKTHLLQVWCFAVIYEGGL
jgi:hypothetical protein